MLPIVWRKRAHKNLASILNIIANENPTAAIKIKGIIENSILPVADHPYLYKAGRVGGTRELVAHPNYILVYRVTAVAIEVVSVLHSRQEYPESTA
jgi:toxin ParE1/3/4